MAKVDQVQHVDCPFGKADEHFHRYIDTLPKDASAKPILSLSLPLSGLHLPAGIRLSKEVCADFSAVTQQNLEWRTAVHWAPKGGGPFPEFHGFIRLLAGDNYGFSRLVLDGEYEPPLGSFGRIFDVAFGNRLARATASELLSRLAHAIELGHATDGV